VNHAAALLLLLPPLLLALTIHEWSHGYAALRMGDPTARLLGRLTLNPLAHLDPLGSLLFLIPPHIGWARPVPVDVRYLRHPRRDMMWIAAAGPASNLVLAIVFGAILNGMVRAGVGDPSAPIGSAGASLLIMVKYGVFLNLALMAFNLIPVYPLDGSRVLSGLLSPDLAVRYHALDTVGPVVLLSVIVVGSFVGFNPIGAFIVPVVRGLGGIVTGGLL
jgi:Zn-dependent protease